MLLGGHVGHAEVRVRRRRRCACRPSAAAEATVRVVGRFAAERQAGETFASGSTASGGAGASATSSRTSTSGPTPEERPDFYVDFGETGPYVAETGESECAT